MKKMLSLIIAALISASMLAACGKSSPAPSAEVSPAAQVQSSEAEDGGYLSWKFEDWDSAGDQERKECAEAYVKGMISASGEGEDVTDEEIEAMQDYLVSTLTIMFTADKEATLQEIINESAKEMDSVI